MHDQGLFNTDPTGAISQTTSTHPHTQTRLSWCAGNPPHLRFPALTLYAGLVHGIFTRKGGTSSRPYETLNTSYSVGDRPECVDRNLERIRAALGAERLIFMEQAHRDDIRVVENGRVPKGGLTGDALMTNRPGLPLTVKQADCQAVILYDPVNAAVANIHCGWRGNVRGILAKSVAAMAAHFGSVPTDLVAAVSPSLGPCCGEFRDHHRIFPGRFSDYEVRKDHFDLWAVSRSQLMEAGIPGERICLSGVCTRCRTDLFFSHRGEGLTGRFCTVAMLVDR